MANFRSTLNRFLIFKFKTPAVLKFQPSRICDLFQFSRKILGETCYYLKSELENRNGFIDWLKNGYKFEVKLTSHLKSITDSGKMGIFWKSVINRDDQNLNKNVFIIHWKQNLQYFLNTFTLKFNIGRMHKSFLYQYINFHTHIFTAYIYLYAVNKYKSLTFETIDVIFSFNSRPFPKVEFERNSSIMHSTRSRDTLSPLISS